MKSDAKRYVLIAILLSLLLILPGCLISGSKSVSMQGRAVSESTLSHIDLDVTTKDWVLAALGEPDSRDSWTRESDEAECEILRYEWRKVTDKSGAVFLLFGSSSQIEEQSTTSIEIVDGVVTKYWT